MFAFLIPILTTTFMYSTPLIFAALGGVISERSGVINIGIEGIMTMGMLTKILFNQIRPIYVAYSLNYYKEDSSS